ncbi:MAG: glutamine--tRNA ligase/YqeY domain fusion protein [Gammaproteobacteria bacterium]|nr:glutamine--tRNA ligase/YqeY domain fusion protein [Gammaproteobacteria bacterium]
MKNDATPAPNFIKNIVIDDIKTKKNDAQVRTRFPPEPNGYLHIGHAKSICLNFGIAAEFGGSCNLRFDDSNPVKEDIEYVESIKEDVHWLGFEWARLHHASDYFEQLYDYAIELIKQGKAYIESLSAEQIRTYRGTLKEPGKESPYRNRSVEENLDLFQRMRAGEFPDGSHVLRAKIDMASPNLNMRDPIIYRIRHASHHQTGDQWCIYPMYDYTHCLSDAIEGITHSLCTLEFEDHRPLYDWIVDELNTACHPQQIEFARLELEYTVMSKRKLQQLVEQGLVQGWDDPRMLSISGLRRRGYTPGSIRDFSDRIGVTKKDSVIQMSVLENSIREDLNHRATRVLAVLNPLRVVIENYPQDQVEEIEAINHPNRPELGTRKLPFSRELYIERDDFMEAPPKKFFRLALGREVRLRYAYYITCTQVIKDEQGKIVELKCRYDPATKGGSSPDGRKVKGTLHWVSAAQAIDAEIHLYDRLFKIPNPGAEGDFIQHLNPDSLKILNHGKLEPGLGSADVNTYYQFERQGYFCLDSKDSRQDALVFNRTVTLRDSWAKIEKAHAHRRR